MCWPWQIRPSQILLSGSSEHCIGMKCEFDCNKFWPYSITRRQAYMKLDAQLTIYVVLIVNSVLVWLVKAHMLKCILAIVGLKEYHWWIVSYNNLFGYCLQLIIMLNGISWWSSNVMTSLCLRCMRAGVGCLVHHVSDAALNHPRWASARIPPFS